MSKIKKTPAKEAAEELFPVVGIGASAGGLEAVKQFLKGVPEKSGMAYVFVQHLSPTHESLLPEILAKFSRIPVQQITDKLMLKQDKLYIVPANKIVTAVDGMLKLSDIDEMHPKVKVIDLFFSSLAVVHQSYAVGVVLSGALTDGSLGLQVIKAYGGITFAQDESSAAFDGMPKSAISTGAVDFVLPPEKIAAYIIAINNPFHSDHSKGEIINTVPQQDEEIFKQLLTVLRVRKGVDFNYYKPSTLKRRVIRRMALNSIENPIDYLQFLRDSKTEQDALYNDMLISVTNFFRDPASFTLLCNTIFPALVSIKNENEPLRIWIAGCATGEEAYSIAICLNEQMGDKALSMKIQIFATDISEIAIAKARTGIYRLSDVEGLSPARLLQFFTKLDGQYQVNKEIRDMCVFARHNLLKDPPFSKVDLICCRNVLIYMEPVLQKRALTTFHYALNDQGFLMLGKSESIGNSGGLFAPYNNHEKIFRRKGERGRFMQVTSQIRENNFKNIDNNIQKESGKEDVFKLTDELILSEYTPSGVLINEHFDIIQFRGKTDTWLALPPGKASLNLLRMARESLSFELRNLLYIAKKNNTTTKKEGIVFKSADRQQYVNIEVVPIINTSSDLHYLVLFEEEIRHSHPLTITKAGEKQQAPDAKDLRITQLENELMQVRADMRSVTEEQEAVNEELQSANEELLSGSEELQSLNEELETSKEELQSTNEEITIINNELLDRNEQLNVARSYTEEIINTIRDPLIILDKDLKVRRATAGFYNNFKVTEKETEGQYLYDLGNRQWDIPALRELLESVLPEEKILTGFEVTHIFPSIGKKVMHLNSRLIDRGDGDQLILLAIEDITNKRKVEEGLAKVELLFAESKERLKLAVDAAGLGTWDYNPLTSELLLDNRSKELFGLMPTHETDYEHFIKMIHSEDRENVDKGLKQALKGRNHGEYEKEFRTSDAFGRKIKWIKWKGKAYFNEDGKASRFVGTSLDITVQKKHDETTNELLKQKDDFISIASHELKTPITSLKASLQLIARMKDNPDPKKMDEMIRLSTKSINKVSQLIEDLLNASRFNHGQLKLDKTEFNIAQLVDDCCHYLRVEGDYSIITTGDKALTVYADMQRIEQVLTNFINNAIKYAPNSKEIIVRIAQKYNAATVSVTDKGPGIVPEIRPHLFDRYYRGEASQKHYSGLGLGLYICAEIIKKHGGEIGVDSELGKSSTFWFTIPIS